MDRIAKILKSTSLWVFALVLLAITLVITRECGRDDVECPPKGKVLVTEQFIDSLKIVADTPPDTVVDTIFVKGKTVYVEKEVPVPVEIDPQTNFYSDSIVNDSISVWVDITTKGIIQEWTWKYDPIIIEREKTITIYKPKPVPYEVVVDRTEVYAELGFGGNANSFMLSGELDLITKKDHLYGYQYIRFDNNNFHLFKIGTKISFRR